jgi:uncharacterized protein YbjT (DUF2867 family)
MSENTGKILLTGATGFVGGRLLHALTARGFDVRCLVRTPERLRQRLLPEEEVEIVEGDLLRPETLESVLDSIEVAYYMVHSMGGRTIGENKVFAQKDRTAAENFMRAADQAQVKRIIYLGGLGETGDQLSKHLASRREVAQILSSGNASTTELRAPTIMGAGGAPFEMLRYLAERLPVMICPRWIETRAQPIDIHDMVEYLLGCLREPATAGLSLDVGGPDILNYREMMQIYCKVRGLKRVIITVPVLTPRLSTYWINMVTPVPSGVVNPLVEGLRNEVICRDNRIRELIPIELTSFEQSICTALQEVEKGPGKLASVQSCLLR